VPAPTADWSYTVNGGAPVVYLDDEPWPANSELFNVVLDPGDVLVAKVTLSTGLVVSSNTIVG
jgi:hypothetical protein